MDYDYIYKYIVVGNSAVGKSSLVLRLTDNRFLTSHDYTIGVDFGTRKLILNTRNNVGIKVHIWDTAGQERFRSIARSYYRAVAGVLLVYDVTDAASFYCIPRWLSEIRQDCRNRQVSIMLVGNKADLESRRKISYEDGQRFAHENGLLFAETSARREDENVFNVFMTLTETIYDKVISGEIDATTNDMANTYGITLASLSTNPVITNNTKYTLLNTKKSSSLHERCCQIM